MIYCQDCGAANDQSNPTCRICGRALQFQRSTLRCSACGQFVGVGASFCSGCGAASDDLAFGAQADGGTPPSAAAIEALLAAPPPAERPAVPAPPTPTPDTGLDLGAGLDLPDWLKRAAAEAPRQPAVAAPPPPATLPTGAPLAAPMAAAATATQTPDPAAPASPLLRRLSGAQATVESPVGAAPFGTKAIPPASPPPSTMGEPPLPSLPDGGLSQSLPAWLRPGTGPSSGSTASSGPVAPAPPRPSEDPTDTSSFISESDLPVWLRQLAEAEAAQAEAARRAEEARLAEEAHLAAETRAATDAAGANDPADGAGDELAAEAARSGGSPHAAGRWLARHDQDDPASGRRSAFADLVSERASEQETFASGAAMAAQSEAAEMGAYDRAALTTTVAATQAKVAAAEDAAAKRDAKRWIVIGLLLIVIAVLLAYTFLAGSLA